MHISIQNTRPFLPSDTVRAAGPAVITAANTRTQRPNELSRVEIHPSIILYTVQSSPKFFSRLPLMDK